MAVWKLVLTLPSLAWGHGVVTHPPTFYDATGITSKSMGGNCAFLWCFGYENYTFIKDGAATIKDGNPLKTMKNCRAELYKYLGDGTDKGCLASIGLPPHKGHDIARTHPWRAPGTAPMTSPCGVQGGNPLGCPHGNPGRGGCYSGGWGHGSDNRKLMHQGVVTEWKIGSVQEVKWGNFANHDGGYSYRLCKKPTDPMDLTEECFRKTPLDFVGDTQWIEYVSGKKKGKRVEFTGMTAKENITSPAGSQWRRNPIPACNWLTGRGTRCLGFQFPPFDGKGVFTPFGGYGPFPDWQIVDQVQVPKDLPEGDYVLSWRWDVEEFGQVWSSCSHIRITGSDPSPKADPHPAAERNITCVAPSRELCAEDKFFCLRSGCPSKLFETKLIDFSGDRCNWHCAPLAGADKHSQDEYESLFAPPSDPKEVGCHKEPKTEIVV